MKLRYFIYVAIPLLIVILGISYVTSSFGFSGFTNALVAWGTLMLAFTAFWNIIQTRKENERLRKENRSLRQEERDREFKRHNLEMINNWAQEVLNHLREVHPINDKNDLWKLERIAWRLQLNSVFLRQMQNLFDKKFNTNLINSIDDFSKYGDKIFEIIGTLRLDEQVPEADRKLIKDLEHKSFKSITDLIYAITNTKIKLKI